MPEKEKARREGEEKLIRHLGGEAHGRVHGRLVNQPATKFPGEPEPLHCREVYFAGGKYPLNSPAVAVRRRRNCRAAAPVATLCRQAERLPYNVRVPPTPNES